MSIGEALAAVRERIRGACRLAGRDPASVTLIAVSKTRTAGEVREALAAGQVDFGENYAQELRDKAPLVGPGARWHYIGGLQRNKVKYVAGTASMVHAVDSLALAEELGRRSFPRVTELLVGVNLGGETQKTGVSPAEVTGLCQAVVGIPGVALRGLMCIPPPTEEPEAAAPYFAALRELAARGRAEGLPLELLSMGMSHDFEVAIREGATHVRVGTAIFGERTKKG